MLFRLNENVGLFHCTQKMFHLPSPDQPIFLEIGKSDVKIPVTHQENKSTSFLAMLFKAVTVYELFLS